MSTATKCDCLASDAHDCMELTFRLSGALEPEETIPSTLGCACACHEEGNDALELEVIKGKGGIL